MTAAAMALQSVHLANTPVTTIALTFSGISLAGVGALIFHAGKWLGEHRALEKSVDDGHQELLDRLTEGFARVEKDIRELRTMPGGAR